MAQEMEFSHPYVLWYHSIENPSWTLESYQNLCLGLPKQCIENSTQLARIYKSLDRNITAGMFFLMKKGIKPLWEDPANRNGGFWSFKIHKRFANEKWLQISAALVGNTLTQKVEQMGDVTGISVSPKISNCVIKIWNGGRHKLVFKERVGKIKLLDNGTLMYRSHTRKKKK